MGLHSGEKMMKRCRCALCCFCACDKSKVICAPVFRLVALTFYFRIADSDVRPPKFEKHLLHHIASFILFMKQAHREPHRRREALNVESLKLLALLPISEPKRLLGISYAGFCLEKKIIVKSDRLTCCLICLFI